MFLSEIRTRSPFLKFLFSTSHFFLSIYVGRYSFSHLFQNMSVAAWTAFHFFLRLMSCFWKTHGLQFGLDLPIRRWCWVISSKLLNSSLAAMRRPIFIMLSTSVRNVDKALSVNILSLTIDFNAFFVILAMDSTAPPIHGAQGGLNFYMIYLWFPWIIFDSGII